MSYDDRLEQIVGRSERAMLQLAERRGRDLDDDGFVALAVALMLRVNAETTAFADVALAADLTVKTGSAVPALGLLLREGEAARLDKAFRTFLADLDPGPISPEEATRLSRIARDEPLRTAQTARGEGIRKSRHTQGWTRKLNAGACPACTGWAGPVLPKSAPMARHTGCSCVQVPAVRTTTRR